MIIEPKVRGFLCTTTHPVGCQKNVEDQIAKVAQKFTDPASFPTFKNVLILGGSTGFGLSSRIVSAFGLGSNTLNIALERPYVERNNEVKPASPGWYQTAHVEKLARERGLYAESIIGDAFSNETKDEAVAKIQEMGKIDLLIYSLAAPRRIDPVDGTEYRSVLKPIGEKGVMKSLNANKDGLTEVELDVASEEEILATTKVMGGEDWKLWIEKLQKEDLLSSHCKTMAFSYIGPEVTKSIYRHGTIGQAKVHLEKTASEIDELLKPVEGRAYISVNKGLVTQAAAAIPVLPLYLSILYSIMKGKDIHEQCIEQMIRLFSDKMIKNKNSEEETEVITDEQGFIRLDDWEMREDVQAEVNDRMAKIADDNISQLCDLDGYQRDFLQLFGFQLDGVDYQKEVEAEQIKIDISSK